MKAVRSERFSAVLLLGAAILGLILANTAIGPTLLDVLRTRLTVPGTGLDLSVSRWVSDGLLAVFFFIVAIELKRELVVGELNSASTAALPAIAAIGGVLAPAGIYLLVTPGSGLQGGWPIPTATDIAFALGILAVFGKHIPARVRVFLLALAVLDDLVAILIIAFFFTADPQLQFLGFAAVAVGAFGLLSRLLKPRSRWARSRRPRWPIIAAMVALAVASWAFTDLSGVHPTIAGVVLGLVMARGPGGRAMHILEPYSNGVVLPLFALCAAMVVVPQVKPTELSAAFWGILIALPVGKFLGITIAGALAGLVARRNGRVSLRSADLAVVATLGGVGFTVSLLMNTLAFGKRPEVADEGTLAVLLGSGISIVIAAIAVSTRSRRYLALTRDPGGR